MIGQRQHGRAHTKAKSNDTSSHQKNDSIPKVEGIGQFAEFKRNRWMDIGNTSKTAGLLG